MLTTCKQNLGVAHDVESFQG